MYYVVCTLTKLPQRYHVHGCVSGLSFTPPLGVYLRKGKGYAYVIKIRMSCTLLLPTGELTTYTFPV